MKTTLFGGIIQIIGVLCSKLDYEGKNMEIFIGVIVVILVVILILLCFMAKYTVRPRVRTLEYEKDYLQNLELMQGESIDIVNEHTVTTSDGQILWVGSVPGDSNNKHYVILSHGYTSTRYGTYKYATLWKKLGYNCVVYDNRGHGANEPATITFGIKESQDLMAVIEDTYERYGRDIHIGLHGESMGSGLQVMALAHKPKVDFIVNDCGYSEILPVLRWKVQQRFHLPGWLADVVSPICKLVYGFWFQQVSPIDQLKENEIPICFVHGTNDSFTHMWHSEKMYEANKGYKELHLYEGAEHAECIVKDTDKYYKMLEGFVKKVYTKEEV